MSREKASKVAPLCLTGRFLWSGLGVKIAELRRFPASFRSDIEEFLCSPDWLAEGEGFEPLGTVLER